MQDIVLISIPETTIRSIVEQAVRKVIAENQILSTSHDDGKQLLTRKEVAELTGVCMATIDNKVKAGVLKKYRTGGIVRFKRQEVIDAFSQSMFDKNSRPANGSGRGKKQ